MLDSAITLLEIEVESLSTAKPGTTSWALWQAKSLGLSFLRMAKQKKLTEPDALERFRRTLRRDVVRDESAVDQLLAP